MTARRLTILGLVLGAVTAVTYHFTATVQSAGWFAYAPLSDTFVRDIHPAWWPSAMIGPVVGGLLGLGAAHALKGRRHRA